MSTAQTVIRKIGEILAGSATPLGAYDLLERLRKDHPRLAPPTVYRALESLEREGAIHRLASLNAYLACRHPGEAHAHDDALLLVCTCCHKTDEVAAPKVARKLRDETQPRDFAPVGHTLEVPGLCPDCRAPGHDDSHGHRYTRK